MEIREKIEELERELNELKAYVEINRPITERVKTIGDAVAILGEEHPFVEQWNAVNPDKCSSDLIAYLKLRIITAALNEGWEPQCTEDEYRYYPWLTMYTQEEWDELNEETKKDGVLFGGYANYGARAGFVCADSTYAPSDALADFGSRLCFRTSDLARYAGRQFVDLYADFYLIRK